MAIMMTNDIEWKMVKLGDVCTMPTKTISSNTFETRFYVGTENMLQNCSGIIDNEISISTVRVREYKKDDILMSNIRPYLKKIWFSDKDAGCSTDVNIFRTNGKCFPKYLFHVLCQDDFFNYVNDNAIGTKMPRGDKSLIPNFFIPIPYKNGTPDLETQKQIAQKLGDMDSLIAAKEKLLAKKRNLKTAAMQKLIKDEESDNWKKVKLEELCSMPTKTILTNTFDSKYYIGTENMLRNCSGIIDNEIVLSYGRVREYKKEDILMSNIRPYLKKIWFSDKKAGCSTDVNIFRANGKCVPKYLFHVLCQDDFFNFVNDNAIGTKMPRGDKRIIPTFLVSIPYKNGTPDIVEQSRIVSILSEMDTEIFSIENELIKLQNLKTGMMQSYFSFNEVEE